MEINGAKMFVKALQEEGVDTLFAIPWWNSDRPV